MRLKTLWLKTLRLKTMRLKTMRLKKRRDVQVRETGPHEPLRKQAADRLRPAPRQRREAVENNLMVDTREGIGAQPEERFLQQFPVENSPADRPEEALFLLADCFFRH